MYDRLQQSVSLNVCSKGQNTPYPHFTPHYGERKTLTKDKRPHYGPPPPK